MKREYRDKIGYLVESMDKASSFRTRLVYVRTLRLEPGDTLRQCKYRSQVASVGPKYRSLGVLPADGAHLFTEGQRTMLDGETQRMMLLELVPE